MTAKYNENSATGADSVIIDTETAENTGIDVAAGALPDSVEVSDPDQGPLYEGEDGAPHGESCEEIPSAYGGQPCVD